MSVERELNLTGKAWLALGIGPQRDRPTLHRLARPLSEARLALVTTGGFVPPGAPPFNTGKFGDSSYREIPVDIDPEKLEIFHPHYDDRPVRRDVNILFPLPLCRQLVAEGIVGSLAPTHYSFMGYVPVTRRLVSDYAPALAQQLEAEDVDAILLVPA